MEAGTTNQFQRSFSEKRHIPMLHITRQLWQIGAFLPSSRSTLPPNLVSATNLLRVLPNP